MGNQIRTPRPVYFKNGVIEFYVYKKEIYYKAKLWLRDGTSQITIKDRKFLGDADSIVKEITSQFHEKEMLN